MINILLADDHPYLRRGLVQILIDEFPGAVVGEVSNVPELLEQAQKQRWDVVVLDLTMPGRGGLEGLHELKRLCPSLPVLVLSMHPEDQFAVRVLRAGGAGYLTKESAPQELVHAIKTVWKGGNTSRPTRLNSLRHTFINTATVSSRSTIPCPIVSTKCSV